MAAYEYILNFIDEFQIHAVMSRLRRITETSLDSRSCPKVHTSHREPRSYGDWALRLASRLDAACPGLINASLYFADLKRQAFFFCLSEIDWADPAQVATRLCAVAPSACEASPEPEVRIARVLATARARDVVRALCGNIPDGLLGALARIGDQPLAKHDYRLLAGFFSDPKLRKKGRVLRHVGKVDKDVLRVLDVLGNERLLAPQIIRMLANQSNAYDFVRTIRWLEDQDHVDGEALHASARRATSERSLGRALRRWIEQAEYLPQLPALDHPHFQLLTTISQLRQKGLEYRVCLGSSDTILEGVLGLTCFAEWRPRSSELGAVVELRPLIRQVDGERHWYVASVNLADNAPVPRELRDHVCDALAQLGVFRPVQPAGTETAACVSRLLRRLDGDWTVDFEME